MTRSATKDRLRGVQKSTVHSVDNGHTDLSRPWMAPTVMIYLKYGGNAQYCTLLWRCSGRSGVQRGPRGDDGLFECPLEFVWESEVPIFKCIIFTKSA